MLLLWLLLQLLVISTMDIFLNELCMMFHRIRWVLHQQLKLNLKITAHTSMVMFSVFMNSGNHTRSVAY